MRPFVKTSLNRDFLAASRRETRIARRLILRLRPDLTIWPSRWQNGIGQTSFVAELPPGELPDRLARRHAAAVLRPAE